MASDGYIHEDTQDSTRRRHGAWVLPILIVLGFLVYEVTAQPALGVAIVCLKFGWDDFRTALWLRRVDPDRRRGRACFWLFLAFGLLKTAITASILVSAYIVAFAPRAPNNQPGDEVTVAAFTALAGFTLSILATCIALFEAWRGCIRLWLDASVHRARRQNCWPPPDPHEPRKNEARVVILTGLVPLSLMVIPWLFYLPIAGLLLIGVPELIVGAIGAGAFPVVAAVVVLAFRNYLARGLAKRPSECWGPADSIDTVLDRKDDALHLDSLPIDNNSIWAHRATQSVAGDVPTQERGNENTCY